MGALVAVHSLPVKNVLFPPLLWVLLELVTYVFRQHFWFPLWLLCEDKLAEEEETAGN